MPRRRDAYRNRRRAVPVPARAGQHRVAGSVPGSAPRPPCPSRRTAGTRSR